MTRMSSDKAELRARMRAARGRISSAVRAGLSRSIEDRLFSLLEMAEPQRVLLFYSFGSEVVTRGMLDRVLAEGKTLLLPFLDQGVMEAAEVRPAEDLVPTSYGPHEPSRRVAVDPGSVDAVVTPGLAFDRRGRRLGYGGGHYDRYLSRLGPAALRVGVGFSAQVVDRVPAGPGDQRVHLVVTDAEVIDCRQAPGNTSDQRR
jgi:5-formyltetrahydrofolate cyclo-ligase